MMEKKGFDCLSKAFSNIKRKKKEKWILLENKNTIGNATTDFHIELNGSGELVAEGVSGVIEYKNDFIKLQIKNGYITLFGSDFDIKNYEYGSLCVLGRISSIEIAR